MIALGPRGFVMKRSARLANERCKLLNEIFQQIERDPEPVASGRPQIVYGSNLGRQSRLGGDNRRSTDRLVTQGVFRLETSDRDGRHTGQSDANVGDLSTTQPSHSGKTNFRDGLSLARADLAIVMRQTFGLAS